MIYAEYKDLTSKALLRLVERQREDLWEAERNFKRIDEEYKVGKRNIDRMIDDLEKIEIELGTRTDIEEVL